MVRNYGVMSNCSMAILSALSIFRSMGADGGVAMRLGACKWRLMHNVGEPQWFRVRPGPGDTRVVEFFSPVPMWARRRWDAVGETSAKLGMFIRYRMTETDWRRNFGSFAMCCG
jgi:hypothetical protein